MRLRRARKKLKIAIATAKSKWVLSKCKSMNDASSTKRGTSSCWAVLKEIKTGMSKVRPSCDRMMKKSDGSKCKTSEENADVFREHFKQLYERVPEFNADAVALLDQLPVMTEYDMEPTDDEIRKAISKLKEKAPGDSGILPRIWKALAEEEATFKLLKMIIMRFWMSEKPPKEWLLGLLKILPKKGDLSLPDNYRGIMLLEAAYKIVAILLHNRLQPIAENLDQEEQCGFRPGRGCADAVFSVKIAMKKRREHGLETWILFLDLVKAFDRVPREMLWAVLKRFGIPPKLIRLLTVLHEDLEVKFVVDDVTHVINFSIGVKQGDILGPVLFIIYMVAVMKSWREAYDRPVCIFRTKEDYTLTGRRYNAKGEEFSVKDSEYADDTAVLFPSRECTEEYSPKLVKHFQSFGLEIHVGDINKPDKPSKTEILFVAAPPSAYKDPASYDSKDLSNINLGDGKYFPVVDKFCHLGSILTRDCRDDVDVLTRIEAAGNAFGSMRESLFSNRNISHAAKKVVYEGLILPILLYGAESWSLTEALFRQLRLFHARCVRAMCRVNRWHVRKHHIQTSELLTRLGLLTIDAYTTRRQLQWAGHVIRMPFRRLPRKMMTSWVSSKRPIGCPSFTYGRGLYKSLRKADLERDSWFLVARERTKWTEIVSSLK